MLGGPVLPPVIAIVPRNGVAALAGDIWTVVKGGSDPRFLAYFNSWCHPSTSRAVGREYSVESKFGSKQGELAPGLQVVSKLLRLPHASSALACGIATCLRFQLSPTPRAATCDGSWSAGRVTAGEPCCGHRGHTWKRQWRAGTREAGEKKQSE